MSDESQSNALVGGLSIILLKTWEEGEEGVPGWQVVPNSHNLPVAPTQQPKIHMDKQADLTSLQAVPPLLTWAIKDTAGFLVSPSAFLSCCALTSSSYIFFHSLLIAEALAGMGEMSH